MAAATYARTRYAAESLVMMMIDRSHAGISDVAGTLPSVLSIDGLKSVDSEIRILESRRVIEDTLSALDPVTLFPEIARPRLFGLLPADSPQDQLEKAIDKFKRRLQVEQQSSSNIVRLSFSHEDPDLAADTVNALADAYLKRRRAIFDIPRSPFLASELARHSDQLKSIEGQIQALKSEYDIVDLGQESLLAANQVDSIVQRRRQTQERQAALQAEVTAAKKRLAALPERVFDFREQSNQTQNDDDRNVLLRLELERDRMASQFLPDYPPLQELERKIRTVRQSMKGGDKPVYNTTREVRNPSIPFLNNHLLTLEIEQDAVARQLDELNRQHTVAVEKVGRLRKAESELRDLERTRGVMEDIYRDYAQRTEAARAEEEAAKVRFSNVRVVQPAVAPATGTSMAPSFIIAGLVGGILLGGAAGVLATWLRQVYILPHEIERDLGVPAIASFSDTDGELVSPGAQQELIHLAAQLRDHGLDDQPMALIQFVTANDGDGDAIVARGLALEFAKGRGLRTLVIDLCGDGTGQLTAINAGADDKTDGEAAGEVDSGAGERLPTIEPQGTGDLEALPSAVPLLWVSRQATGSALGSLRTPIAQSRQMLERLNQRFDIILILSPPIGNSHLARRLSPMVDANILVARAEHTRAPVAARMRDSILASGGDIVGLVLTGRHFHIPQVIYRWL
ncbi:GumC family protein [Azospirillum himalayense]|uniref:GumC family protein n=2 Tax=Azospirillum himalayense TaxID=654847 RepID=A0ABW0FY46_9PROT